MADKATAGREILGGFAPKLANLNDDVLFEQALVPRAPALPAPPEHRDHDCRGGGRQRA